MLRDYQQKNIRELRDEFRAMKRAPLYVLSTGGGKTFVFCHIAQGVNAKNKTVLILVHRRSLLYQGSRSLRTIGVKHGLIAPGFRDGGNAVVMASVQTLRQRLKGLTPEEIERKFPYDLIIIDEAHHAVAGTWKYILERFPKAKLLGVTATPIRSDGKGLGIQAGGVFDCMVEGPSMAELIERGYLSPYVLYAPPSKVDLKGVHTRNGDFDAKELAERLDKPTITGDAVSHYSRICPYKPAIVFCASVKHAEHVAAQFGEAGYVARSIDGKMSDAEQRALINGLADGSIHVLTSCDVISEGTDIPVVECAILLRPTKSEGLYLQQVGRALRTAPGKQRAVILDHVGNCLIHGMPDEPREWTLEGKKKKKRGKQERTIPLKQCPKCYAFHAAAATACTECGHVYEVKGRKIEHVAGDLREITDADREKLRMEKRESLIRAKNLNDYIAHAKRFGYKNPVWWAKKAFGEQKQSIEAAQSIQDLVALGYRLKKHNPEQWARTVARNRGMA